MDVPRVEWYFSVISHWSDENIKFQSRQVQKIQMEGTFGVFLSHQNYSSFLQQHKIENKIIACVADEGIN